jgi:hypothetical protein
LESVTGEEEMTIVLQISRTRDFFSRPTAAIKAKYDNVLAGYSLEIQARMKAEIAADKWNMGVDPETQKPFQTLRWAGGVRLAGQVRDIIDSGNLYSSFYGTVNEKREGSEYTVGNSADYVDAIRFGYISQRSAYSKAKGRFRPRYVEGRDFVAAAFRSLPFKPYLAAAGAQKANVNFGRVSAGSTPTAPSFYT